MLMKKEKVILLLRLKKLTAKKEQSIPDSEWMSQRAFHISTYFHFYII